MEQVWLVPIKEIISFIKWWGWQTPQTILYWTKNLLLDFDNNLQFGANLRLWLSVEPMFGDYTWSGRVTGFLIRGVRVAVTLLVYAAILIAGILATLIWWALPVILLIKFEL